MTGVTETSRQSYKQIKPQLGTKQKTMLYKYRLHHPKAFNDRQIAEKLGWTINSTTPRRGELADLGLLEPAGFTFDSVTKRRTQLWRAKQP